MKSVFAILLVLLMAGCSQASSDNGAPAAGPVASSARQSARTETAGAAAADAANVVEKILAGSGVSITGPLAAPAGFHGFVGNYHGHPIPIYLLPDGTHVVIGTLLDTNGHDLTGPAMQKVANAGRPTSQWKQLQDASWFVAGNPHAKHVVYAFMDTRCPFCHQLWSESKPFLKSGKVQLRVILVAVITSASLPEGALVLDSNDPLRAWQKNEQGFGHNPKPAPDTGSAVSRAKIKANSALMQGLGFRGTPAVVYKDAQGHIRTLVGAPRSSAVLEKIYGISAQ
jgi:thiol:disulfide interchange protein DsbG